MLDKFRETTIVWDKANKIIYEKLRASESDSNGRKLSVQVVNAGVVESLSGASLSLYWETKDKAHNGLDAFEATSVGTGIFEIPYTTGMLSNKGDLTCHLVLVDPTGRTVSEPFTITVFRGIDDDAIQSSDSFTALTEALAQVSTINNKADRAELLALESTFEQNKVSVEQQLQQKPTSLKTEIVYTVGEDGDFQTINEALEEITNLYPTYKFNSEEMGVTILLKSGFVMQEQVFVDGLDLSFVSLKSEDNEVIIRRSALTKSIGSVARFPAFAFSNGAKTPKIYVLFNMDETGVAEQRNGFNIRLGSVVLLQKGAGCKNAGGRGLHVANGDGYANNTIFTGAKQAGVRVANGGRLFADGVDVSNSLIGLLVDEGYVTARDGKANNCETAIRSVQSEIDFKGGEALNCENVLSSTDKSEVIMLEGNFKNSQTLGMSVTRMSRVYADFSDFSGAQGRVFNISNSELNARLANLLSETDVSAQITSSKIDIGESQIKRLFITHGSFVNARNTVDTSYEGEETFYNFSGVGNTLIAEGTSGSVGIPINQLNRSGTVYK